MFFPDTDSGIPKAMVTLLENIFSFIAAFPALNMIRLSIWWLAAIPTAEPKAIPRLIPENAQVVPCCIAFPQFPIPHSPQCAVDI